MRHGARHHDPFTPESEQTLSEAGRSACRETAGALAELMTGLSAADPIALGTILHGNHRPTRETVNEVREVLKVRGVSAPRQEICAQLDPDWFWRQASGERGLVAVDLYQQLRKTLDRKQTSRSGTPVHPNAVLVIGHQPQLSWIAETLTGAAEAVAGAEILCLEVCEARSVAVPPRRCWRLVWALTPSAVAQEALPELRDKIKSKMDVAKLLGALIIAVLGWIGGKLLEPNTQQFLQSPRGYIFAAGIACLFGALGLYLVTMYAYDRLLMPTRFWGESARVRENSPIVRRPPSSAARVLHQNMIRVWNRMFLPATILVVTGLALFAASVFLPMFVSNGYPADRPLAVLLVLLILAAVCARYLWVSVYPRLGSED
jgi:phosphohistidine phosphatase SixA